MKFKLCIILLALFVRSTAGENPKNILQTGDIAGTRVFVENKGQFDNHPVIKDKILFALTNGAERIFFTKKGLVYELSKPFNRLEKGADKGNGAKKPEIHYVTMNWISANSQVKIEEGEKQKHYFTYGKKALNSSCYKKITYKNLYPNIDVEYIFPKDSKHGIKYNLVLRPGANPADIKMTYSGEATGTELDKEGNIHIKTPVDDITEHTPKSFYADGKTIASGFTLKENTIGFTLTGIKQVAKTIIIDPSITWQQMTVDNTLNFFGYDVDYDDLQRMYVYGSDGRASYNVFQYDPDGTLNWIFYGSITFPSPPYSWDTYGTNYYASNFAVKRSNSKTFIGQCDDNKGASVLCLDQNGNFDNYTLYSTTYDEIWDMSYDRRTDNIYSYGGGRSANGVSSNPLAALVNEVTGVLDTVTFFTEYGTHSAASHALDNNSEHYIIIGESSGGNGGNNKNYIAKINSVFTSSVWAQNSAFSDMQGMGNKQDYYYANKSTGYNCLAASDHYLYYYNGRDLAVYSKRNGALLGSKQIIDEKPMRSGGIAVDNCNNVFVGGNDTIYCFNFWYDFTYDIATFSEQKDYKIPLNLDGNPITGSENQVYDIKLDQKTNMLYYCGTAFAGMYYLKDKPNCLSFMLSNTCGDKTATIRLADENRYDSIDVGMYRQGVLNGLNLVPQTQMTPTLGINYTWYDGNGITVLGSSLNDTTAGNSFVFQTAGTYSASAEIPGTGIVQGFTFQINFNCPLPPCCNTIDITGLPNYNAALQTANVCTGSLISVSASCNAATDYTISYNDGLSGPDYSSTGSHVYAANNGSYPMVITASSPYCGAVSRTITIKTTASVCPTCCMSDFVAGFSNIVTNSSNIQVANVCPFNTLNLTGTCPTATSYTFNFGDGTGNFTTSSAAPAHTYANPGMYNLVVTAKGPDCIATTKTISVISSYSNCQVCCSNISISAFGNYNSTNSTMSTCPFNVSNLVASCPSANNWEIRWGDGAISTISSAGSVNTSHQYIPGVFTATIMASGNFSEGCLTMKTILVTSAYANCPPCCNTPFVLGVTGGTLTAPNTYSFNVCPQNPLNLNALCGTGSSIINYHYSDGYNSTGPTSSHAFATYGNKNVVVETIDINSGCFTSETLLLNYSLSNCNPCCSPNMNLTSSTGLQNVVNNGTLTTANACYYTPVSLGVSCPGATAYVWNFGDGSPTQTLTGNPAAHGFPAPGIYSVNINALGTGCYTPHRIVIDASQANCSPCCSNILVFGNSMYNLLITSTPSIAVAKVCMSAPLSLTANCPAASSFTWNFGDGTPDVYGMITPGHTYATTGIYPITVKASNPSGCYKILQINASVSYSICTSCCSNGFVTASGIQSLTAGSSNTYSSNVCYTSPLNLNANCSNATSYQWNFGNGYTTTGANASCTYASPGNYIVTVLATGPNCALSQTINANVSYTNCAPCCNSIYINGTGFQYLGATATPTVYTANTCPNTNFNLNASSCTAMTSYTWNLGDGTPDIYTPGLSHQYTTPNNYDISLTGTGPSCYQNQLIHVNNSFNNCPPCCTSGFVTSTGGLQNIMATGVPNVYTAFTCVNNLLSLNASACSSATSFNWNFGNGSAATTGASATGQYASAGNYTITVSANGSNCSSPTQTLCVNVSDDAIIAPAVSCTGLVTMAVNACMVSPATYTWNFGDGTFGSGDNVVHNYNSAGTFFVQLFTGTSPSAYSQNITINNCQPPQPCTNCIGSFAPKEGKYILNLWVREDINPTPLTYSNAKIELSFTGDPAMYTFGTDITKNKIIEGWQRIEETFIIPVNATHLNLRLLNTIATGGANAYFDDIRISPIDGQMKTYVYDPVTLKLSAVLDENNYATFYEYDEEGKLTRVKKETEKGIMTIQENKESRKKR